ncbi:MAG: hypothetical protein MZV65_33615 [Chromatiales bacterium]|nr:hypothetical protein [Chromatiales bacterium]
MSPMPPDAPRPQQITMDEARASAERGHACRIWPSRSGSTTACMREQLGVEPQYPDLAQGLAACVAAEAAGEDQEARG